jgi:hypothetical protein
VVSIWCECPVSPGAWSCNYTKLLVKLCACQNTGKPTTFDLACPLKAEVMPVVQMLVMKSMCIVVSYALKNSENTFFYFLSDMCIVNEVVASCLTLLMVFGT